VVGVECTLRVLAATTATISTQGPQDKMATPGGIVSIGPLRKAVHGKGRAELRVFGDNAHFSDLSYTYPLKLLSPRSTTAAQNEAAQRVAILYSLSYGGGLISGDRIELSLDVKEAAKLLLLTQVRILFKRRSIRSSDISCSRGRPRSFRQDQINVSRREWQKEIQTHDRLYKECLLTSNHRHFWFFFQIL
jgi:hypothetical protein